MESVLKIDGGVKIATMVPIPLNEVFKAPDPMQPIVHERPFFDVLNKNKHLEVDSVSTTFTESEAYNWGRRLLDSGDPNADFNMDSYN